MSRDITNDDDLIDSRDIITRIEELESSVTETFRILNATSGVEVFSSADKDEFLEKLQELLNDDSIDPDFDELEDGVFEQGDYKALVVSVFGDPDEAKEHMTLCKLRDECQGCGDWDYGETLVRHDYFVQHTKELIDDCYEMPKEFSTNDWPYRHIKIDYEAAAEELKIDYTEVDFDGVTYFIRS